MPAVFKQGKRRQDIKPVIADGFPPLRGLSPAWDFGYRLHRRRRSTYAVFLSALEGVFLIRSEFSLECLVEDGGEQGVKLGGGLGLKQFKRIYLFLEVL